MTDFTQALHTKGQRATPARLAVLGALEQEKRPLSVEKIIDAIGKNDIDYVTAYRTITMLKKAGLIRQIDFQHNHAHYEITPLKDHHHVVCMKCDAVADVANCNAEAMQRVALKESGFQKITEHSLEFFGICKKCAV